MNIAQRLKQAALAIATLTVASQVFGAKMDLETHTVVIDRLAAIVKTLDDNDSSKVPSSLRLADLLAERSRLKALKEVEQNCSNCLKSTEDRRMALNYYTFAIPRLSGETRSQALLQKAHLHYTLGELVATEKIYRQVIAEGKKSHSEEILGQAYASLGDVLFQKADFKTAKQQYEKALALKDTPSKGIVHFRLAWCLFNLEQVPQAIAKLEMILQTPKLTEMTNFEGATGQDESFKIDVSKDLASFYARNTITRATITRLLEISPASQKQSNIYTLGTEADRLGKKKEAALVWMIYLENNTDDKNALEAQIKLMRLKRDMGEARSALATFAYVGKLWQKPGCGEKCSELQGQIRKWITDWNREEKKIQTPELTHAYLTYSDIFPEDHEMLFRGASVAQQRHQYRQAFELYYKAAIQAHRNISKSDKLNADQRKILFETFDAALIGEIDMAETLKDHDIRLKAYNHYLELNPKGSKEFEVRYQIAQAEFEKKNLERAADLFRGLALENNPKGGALHKTAAHMSIECLIKLNKEENIEKWSLEYVKHFPQNVPEFAAIYRKAVLNLTAARINQKKADAGDLAKLLAVPLAGSTVKERISLYQSRYLLAVRLEKFQEAKNANQELLTVKELTAADRDEAWRNRIWLAELELDFKVAYHLAEAHSNKATADSSLRLIWLAEMAGQNPEKHENNFLRLSGNKALRATVITNRVNRSANPEREMKKYMSELSQSPETLARLSLEIYAKNHKMDILKNAYSYNSVKRSTTGPIINRLLSYKEINAEIAHLSFARLDTRSEKGLKKSLENRIKMLHGLEKTAQRAISAHDVVMQAILLDSLKNENIRLHNDILNLPMPRGLKPEQKAEYEGLVAEQAQPYAVKASQLDTKLKQLWSKGNWSEQLANNYLQARNEYKPALRQDIEQLSRHAPVEYRQNLALALSTPSSAPSEKTLAKAREQIKKNPFEQNYVSELRDLENRRGNDVVVAHLDARLHQMRGTLK